MFREILVVNVFEAYLSSSSEESGDNSDNLFGKNDLKIEKEKVFLQI